MTAIRSRFPLFQTIGIAASVVMVFFISYGRITRPAVPTPIVAIANLYAPGAKLGAPASASLPAMREVSLVAGLGWVGAPVSAKVFDQIQLLPAAGRASAKPDPKRTVITSVQLISHVTYSSEVLLQMAGVFRRPPIQGCLTPSDEDLPRRQVQYWTTPRDLGGVALVWDWNVPPPSRVVSAEVWSLVIWTGPFQGSATLHGTFSLGQCPLR